MKNVNKPILVVSAALLMMISQAHAETFVWCESAQKGIPPYAIAFADGVGSKVSDIATVVPVNQGQQSTLFKPVKVENRKSWPEGVYSASTVDKSKSVRIEILENKKTNSNGADQFRAKLKLISPEGEFTDNAVTCTHKEVSQPGT